jgi:chromosome segregation ATPase
MFLLAAIIAFAATARADQPTKPESKAQGILSVSDSRLADELEPLVPSKSLKKDAIANVSQDAAWEKYEVARAVGRKYDGGVIVSVESFDERVPAGKLLEKLAAVLEKKLQSLDAAHQQDEERAERLTKEVERIGEELRKQQQALWQLAAIHHVSLYPELAAQMTMQRKAELEQLDAQLDGLKARREVIEKQIAGLSKEVASVAADRQVLKDLLKSVEYRKAIVTNLRAMFDAATITQEKVLEAEDKLAQAEAEVARFRAQAALQAGGARIEELKRRLDDTAIEMAEVSARGAAVQKQFEESLSSSTEVEIKRLEVERLKQDYRDAAEELSKLRTKLKLYIPPQVTLVPLE